MSCRKRCNVGYVLAAILALVFTGAIAAALWAMYTYGWYPNREVMILVFCVGICAGCALIIGGTCCIAKSCQCCGRGGSREDNENINLL